MSIEKLLEGQELSEEFKTKLSTLVESSVKEASDKLVEEHEEKIKQIEEAQAEKLAEALEAEKTILEDKVSEFLDAIIKEWAVENEVAVESGVKVEIAESFISGMKGLLSEHDVQAPEGQKDMVESLEGEVTKLKESLDKEIAGKIKAISEMKSFKRDLVILEVCEDLADTEVEKVKSLTEDFDFESEDKFKTKVEIVKEAHFKKDTKVDESVEGQDHTSSELSESVKAYLNL